MRVRAGISSKTWTLPSSRRGPPAPDILGGALPRSDRKGRHYSVAWRRQHAALCAQGYEVGDLSETITKAKAAGAAVLVEPYTSRGRNAAILQFPGGPIAEVHALAGR
jgi:hypothetical protein